MSSGGEQLGQKLRKMRGLPPVTFSRSKPVVHKYNGEESISNYSESDAGGSASSEKSSSKKGAKSSSFQFGTKARLLVLLGGALVAAIAVYSQKKPKVDNGKEPNEEEVAKAKKWAVSAAAVVAAVLGYLLFVYSGSK